MSDSRAAAAAPTLCLNMIVRNEAHVVREVLDAAAPYISCWVIVDTGSDDGTQEIIRAHMDALGIPGELHERPWRNFGHNRSEALALARGHAQYIWVMDADDAIVGELDVRGLHDDAYQLRYGADFQYWRLQIFRDGLPWRYEGVVHEYATCDVPFTTTRLDGPYYLESRRLGARNRDPDKYARDRDLLLAEVTRNPEDARSVFYLAQSCFDAGDPAQALEWYRRRAAMGGWVEEVFCALLRCAECLAALDTPWPDVQEAYLEAWEYRPSRAEPLHAIAARCRAAGLYQRGYLFARAAADIPLPGDDILFVHGDVYTWRARDEQAICAYWIGRHAESFALCRRLLATPAVPDADRVRITENRDFSVPALLRASVGHPAEAVDRIAGHAADRQGPAEITLTVVGADPDGLELTLGSFLACCADAGRIGRFVCLDVGLGAAARAEILTRYPFLEFATAEGDGPAGPVFLGALDGIVEGDYWLHLTADWHFYAPERHVGRCLDVFAAEPDVVQVVLNLDDALDLPARAVGAAELRRTAAGQGYVLLDERAPADAPIRGPSMVHTARAARAARVWADAVAVPSSAPPPGLAVAAFDEPLGVHRRPEPAVTSPPAVPGDR